MLQKLVPLINYILVPVFVAIFFMPYAYGMRIYRRRKQNTAESYRPIRCEVSTKMLTILLSSINH